MPTTSVSTDRSSIIPTGVHRFVVVDVEEKMGGSGHPYWNFTVEVAEGKAWDGQTIWHIVSLSPNARWRMDNWLDAFQVPPGKEVNGEYFVGKTFRGQVDHDTYEGKTRPKISTELPDAKPEGPAKPTTRKGSRAVVIEKAEEPEEDVNEVLGLAAAEDTTEEGPDKAAEASDSAAADGSDVKTDKGLPEIKTTGARGRKRKVF